MIAAIYARKSTDLWSAIVAGWRWIDWTAVASLATFAAVVVALIPIFLAWRRDRMLRKLVLAQAMTHIITLRSVFIWQGEVQGRYAVSPGMRADIDGLRALLPSGHLLHKAEVLALVRASAQMTALASLGSYDDEDAATFAIELDMSAKGLEMRSSEKTGGNDGQTR